MTIDTRRYSVVSYWGPRATTPTDCASRFERLLSELSEIDPSFGNWNVYDEKTATPYDSLDHKGIVDYIASRVSRTESGKPTPISGYYFGAFSDGLIKTPRTWGVSIHAGQEFAANYRINSADIDSAPLCDENAELITLAVLKRLLLTLVSCWEPNWCGLIPWAIVDVEKKRTRPRFGAAWMTYLSPAFAQLVTPPSSAIVEHLSGGGLLMTATNERFDADNPKHMAVARDCETALAPINALPWPPEQALGLWSPPATSQTR